MSGHSYDLLLTGAHVLCMDAAGTQYPDGYVAVSGANIAALGAMSALPADVKATARLDCGGCVVLPGLINAHTHLPMSYFRGHGRRSAAH